MPRHLDAPETAALVNAQLTVLEARQLEKDLATLARGYGRAVARVRKLKAQLRDAEKDQREFRRRMRFLISVRRA